jgi:hypothetical protein
MKIPVQFIALYVLTLSEATGTVNVMMILLVEVVLVCPSLPPLAAG